MRKLIVILALILLCVLPIKAELDTLAYVILKDPIKTDANTLEFSLHIMNKSEKWNWFANGSFLIELPLDIENTNVENFDFAFMEDEINPKSLTDKYSRTLFVTDNSFLINILGPAKISDCVYIHRDSIVSLGRYSITGKQNINFKDSLAWKKPLNTHQSCAYKAHNDSIISTDIIWFKESDNIEMTDRHGLTYCDYRIERTPPPEFVLDFFRVDYLGSGTVEISWGTESEAYNNGFSLFRIPSTIGNNSYDEINAVLVADFLSDERLQGCKNYEGKSYPVIYDTLTNEGISYKYILTYTDYNDEVSRIDSAEVFCPKAIISYAQPNPNPFIEQTVVDYIAEDDVIIDASIFDVKGKEVISLFNNYKIQKGRHKIVISNEQLHSSGFYELVINAMPTNKSKKYRSQVVIPLHLLN